MDIVENARLYLDTPFKHQGASVYGCDCLGFGKMIARDQGYQIEYEHNYSQTPDFAYMKKEMDRQLTRVSRNPIYGDIMLMNCGGYPHLAIRTDKGMIHAFGKAGKVVEHVFSEKWQQKVKGVYTLG